ncbi:hypothetical protein C8F01DRAFT_1021086, partial [Mycena amicta]
MPLPSNSLAMYVPFLTKRGGGSNSSNSKTLSSSSSITVAGETRSTSTSSSGGGDRFRIPFRQLFAGRVEGGGTRSQVWGTKAYGSGYPDHYTRGVDGRPFPFYFWPISWDSRPLYGLDATYMHTDEYGDSTNTSRPGGALVSVTLQSNSSTFHLIADHSSVAALIPFIAANCSSHLTPASPFNASESLLQPEQAVQYFRASSAVLTLDGYNNTAAFAPENSAVDTPLPAGADLVLLDCLNATIAQAVPLVD